MKQKKKVLIHTTTGEVKPLLSGKYGDYAISNGFRFGLKKWLGWGYEERMMTREEVEAAGYKYREYEASVAEERRRAKLEARAAQVELCSVPLPILPNPHYNPLLTPFTEVVNLTGGMLDAYHGAGKGTAYVRDNAVIAWHYGYDRPNNAPSDCIPIAVELSCTQICFRGR